MEDVMEVEEVVWPRGQGGARKASVSTRSSAMGRGTQSHMGCPDMGPKV